MNEFKIKHNGRVYVDRATVVAEIDAMLNKHGIDTGLAYEISMYTTILDSENPDHYKANP